MKDIWGVAIYKKTKESWSENDAYSGWELISISTEMYNKRWDAVDFITKTRSGNPTESQFYGHYVSEDGKIKYVIKGFELKE